MDSSLLSRASSLNRALARFGHARFRDGQREAIETLLETGRLLLVAPTGGGKSLTYQLPASLLPGTTLVVSPLIALTPLQPELPVAGGGTRLPAAGRGRGTTTACRGLALSGLSRRHGWHDEKLRAG